MKSENLNHKIRKSFIARCVYTYKEFVLVTEASTVQPELTVNVIQKNINNN